MYEFVKAGKAPKGIGARGQILRHTAFAFYRCRSCRRLLTYFDERRALQRNGDDCSVCPCGARTYNPTNLVGLERIYPRVLWFRLKNWLHDY